MKKILLKTLCATTLSVIGSLFAAFLILSSLGSRLDGFALIMCVVCPIVVAAPASAHTFWQSERMRRLHARLAAAHEALSAAHSALVEKSRRDFMTGFLNRESFLQELRERRRTDKGALLIIDADDFKSINDQYGHLVGDEALRQIAAAIGRIVRHEDVVGRIGGEEFAVLLSRASMPDAAILAERIRVEVEQILFSPQGVAQPLTVSIGGVALDPEMSVSAHMRIADARLYAAKRQGRNLTVFDFDAKAAA